MGVVLDDHLENGEAIFRQCILSHVITAKCTAPLMIRARRGLIVEVTEGDALSAGGNPLTQMVKLALKGLALNMAVGALASRRRGRGDCAGIPSLRVDARASGRHRRQLARRGAEEPQFPRVRVALVRRTRGGRARTGSATCSTGPASCAARGSWRASTSSPITTAVIPTGARLRDRLVGAAARLFVEVYRNGTRPAARSG